MTFTKQLTDKLCKKRVVYSVTNVRGLCSNSCSPSDQWILTAKTSHGPKKLFMKVFFHSHECMHEDVQKACDALEYERKVYENILPMTHYQFFPVFCYCYSVFFRACESNPLRVRVRGACKFLCCCRMNPLASALFGFAFRIRSRRFLSRERELCGFPANQFL